MDTVIKLFTALFMLFVLLAIGSMLLAGNMDIFQALDGIASFIEAFISALESL